MSSKRNPDLEVETSQPERASAPVKRKVRPGKLPAAAEGKVRSTGATRAERLLPSDASRFKSAAMLPEVFAAVRARGDGGPPDIVRLSDALTTSRTPVARPAGPKMEVVIGKDDRERVAPTTTFPWCAIASLIITTRDGEVGVGTGWFVSPRLLLTAGHCVFIHSHNPARHGWAASIVIMPGRDGAITPIGVARTSKFKSVKGWTKKADQGFDYGGIILPPNQPLGNETGTFGLAAVTDDELSERKVSIAGYPDDKSGDETGTQWFHAQSIAGVWPRQLSYLVDTAGGQSGSPVFGVVDGGYSALAVHAYGDSSANSGTRITPEVISIVEGWML